MRDQSRQVMSNKKVVRAITDESDKLETSETLVTTLVYLPDDSKCLRAFTVLNLLTDLMFKTSSLFLYFGYFAHYSDNSPI